MKNEMREKPVIVVVKKTAGHGHHGGAWKVAFADFMTAMMAMFLVLWIVGQSSDVKSAVAGHFQDPAGRASEFGSSIMPGTGAARPPLIRPLTLTEITDIRIDRLGRMARQLENELDRLPELRSVAEHVEITVTRSGLRIELLETTDGLFFESGRANVHPEAQQLLLALGAELSVLPNAVIIEGHTDATAFPNPDYGNWELSTDRANAARRLLVAGGLSVDQISSVIGYADRHPRENTDPGSPENRRVTITMELGLDAGTELENAEQDATPEDSTTVSSSSGGGR